MHYYYTRCVDSALVGSRDRMKDKGASERQRGRGRRDKERERRERRGNITSKLILDRVAYSLYGIHIILLFIIITVYLLCKGREKGRDE
jgi:hypothetical protein